MADLFDICIACGEDWGDHYPDLNGHLCPMPAVSGGGNIPNTTGAVFKHTSITTMCTACGFERGSHYPRGIPYAGQRLCPKMIASGGTMPNTIGKIFTVKKSSPPAKTPTKTFSRECPCGIFRADCSYHKS